MDLQALIGFFGVSVMLGLTPGPDNLFVLMQSATHGKRAGFVVLLGLCTGLLVHTAAVALGLAAVFATSALAFTVCKLVGAAYLAYLAWQAWRAPVGGSPTEGAQAEGSQHEGSQHEGSQGMAAQRESAPGIQGPALRSLYVRGIVMNLTNPKVILFFLAFLPQFVDAQRGAVAGQLLVLGLVFIAATLLAFGAIAWFAGSVGARLRQSVAAQQMLNRVAALVFAGLAVRLALQSR